MVLTGGVERQLPLGPVDAGVVALQPGTPQHQLEMAKPGDLEGERLSVCKGAIEEERHCFCKHSHSQIAKKGLRNKH